MGNDAICNSLSPTPGLGIQTTKLADNVKSLASSRQMLQAVIQTVQEGGPAVQEKLAPILAQTVQPLLSLGQNAEADLRGVTAQMTAYIEGVGRAVVLARGLGNRAALDDSAIGLLRQAISGLQAQAAATQAAAADASQVLVNYETTANRAAAALNTFNAALDAQDQDIQRKAQALRQQMHDMTSGNCCEQIGHAFQMAFGHLREQLEADERDIQQMEYVYAINLNAMDGLNRMIGKMGDIAAVSSSLELSWRSQADSIVTLSGDLGAVLADATPASIESDMEYVQSDWQSISNTLGKMA